MRVTIDSQYAIKLFQVVNYFIDSEEYGFDDSLEYNLELAKDCQPMLRQILEEMETK